MNENQMTVAEARAGIKIKMKTYTFTFGAQTFTAEAHSYTEALAALVWAVGSEVEAAKYAFVRAE